MDICRITYRITAKDTEDSEDNEDNGDNDVVIHKWHQHAEEIMEFCKALGIPYLGESLGALTVRVTVLLLKVKRHTLRASEKAAIRAAQDGRCAMCGGIVEQRLGLEQFVAERAHLESKRGKGFLDLARVDVRAARDDQVLAAVFQGEKTFFIEGADVAGVQPAVAQRRV